MTSGELAGATIVFDLDGTLVDTAPDLLRALNATMDLEGLPEVQLDDVRHLIGRGARVTIERAAALSSVTYADEKLDELTQAFVGFYREDIAGGSRPFPGVEAALDELSGLGAKLSVCTNKRTGLSQQLLDALNISDRFEAIVGADSVPERKPHPDHFRAAVLRASGDVSRAVMIGDTTIDVATARAAGAPVAVVSFGYCDGDCDAFGADAVLNRFADLAPVCRRLLAAHA